MIHTQPSNAQDWSLTHIFNDSIPAKDNDFGDSVAIIRNKALIGASGNIVEGAMNSGSAYLFDTDTGELLKIFNNPTPANGEYFGNSVAISRNNALIGARRAYENGPINIRSGSAYLFDTNTGELLKTFNNPTPANGEYFGHSVAISGNQALIGAPSAYEAINSIGSAYLFDTNTGKLLDTLTNPTPAHADNFGHSVAISGNQLALIGAPGDDTRAKEGGSAYLFDTNKGELLETFNNPQPRNDDFFGWSVAISRNQALVGAVEITGNGSAYLFDTNKGELLKTFNNPQPRNDDFGRSVAISGNKALVGGSGVLKNASAYLFDTDTGKLLDTLTNPNPANIKSFGNPVAISGNKALVGARNNVNVGSVYLFEPPEPIPEPTTIGASMIGFFSLLGLRKRK